MDEISNQFEKISDTSEARSVEQQSLDDATLRPGAYIEQNSSFQQAEAIQADLVDVSANAARPGSEISNIPLPIPGPEAGVINESRDTAVTPVPLPLPQPGVEGKQVDVGATPQPIPRPAAESQVETLPEPIPEPKNYVVESHQEINATPIPLPTPIPEGDSLIESLPSVRGDLDEVEAYTGDEQLNATPIPLPGNDRPLSATPIPLPGAEDVINASLSDEVANSSDVGATPLPIPRPEEHTIDRQVGEEVTPVPLPLPQPGVEGGQVNVGATPLPIPRPESNITDSRLEIPKGDSPAEIPQGTGELIDFEKPILNREMEDLDQNLGSLDDIGSLVPGVGQLEGDLSGDLLGDLGFSGGPGDLKNEGGGPGSDPNDLFGPGGGPPGAEMLGIGGKGENIFWSWNFLPEQETSYTHAKELTEMQDASGGETEPIAYDPAWQSPPKGEKMDPNDGIAPATSADYAEQEKEMTSFTEAQKQMETEKANQEEARFKRKSQQDTPDEGGDEYNRMQTSPQTGSANPKYDQDQISNYPEDHIAGGQSEGHLSPEHAEQLKESLDAKAKREQSVPKVTTEFVTDPPEPGGGRKNTETSQQGSG